MCLVTTSHVSIHPRVVKSADALAGAGYAVRVVALNADPVRWELEQRLISDRTWRLDALPVRRHGVGRWTWLLAVLRQKLFLQYTKFQGTARGRELALSRYLREVTRLTAREPAELFISHTLEGLPAAITAARKWRTRAGVDFEDLFSGMSPLNGVRTPQDELINSVEAACLPAVAHLTAASPGVADAVVKRHGGARPVPVLNVFPLADRPDVRPPARRGGPLRVYWFSHAIGHDRGLMDALRAMGLLPRGAVELHLRGRCHDAEKAVFRQAAGACGADPGAVVFHAPDRPERMVALAADYDVGLALEQPVSENRIICMNDLCTNKVFTYLLAGVALAVTGMGETREVYDGAGYAYPHGRPDQLAALWKRWLDDGGLLQCAKDTAWRLGGTRYNWDLEKEKLLTAVGRTLEGQSAATEPGSPGNFPN